MRTQPVWPCRPPSLWLISNYPVPCQLHPNHKQTVVEITRMTDENSLLLFLFTYKKDITKIVFFGILLTCIVLCFACIHYKCTNAYKNSKTGKRYGDITRVDGIFPQIKADIKGILATSNISIHLVSPETTSTGLLYKDLIVFRSWCLQLFWTIFRSYQKIIWSWQ